MFGWLKRKSRRRDQSTFYHDSGHVHYGHQITDSGSTAHASQHVHDHDAPGPTTQPADHDSGGGAASDVSSSFDGGGGSDGGGDGGGGGGD